MNVSRRKFLEGLTAAGATTALAGCCAFDSCNFCGPKLGKIGLQLYSIRKYIDNVGLAKALADVAELGYEGVQFFDGKYYGYDAKGIKKLLDDNGLKPCGTHVSRNMFEPDKIKATLEFELGYGNKFVCCPGGGNLPPNLKWGAKFEKPSQEIDDFTKRLCEFYNVAAGTAVSYGAMIGLHNHMWEHEFKMMNGVSFWDFFFTNTIDLVQMEQDVGWSVCAGIDPCEQYRKYPNRSFTLHAKENGMGKDVTSFDAILGQPGRPGAVPVDWDALFPVSDANGIEWYVVECEKHEESLFAVKGSIDFLKGKGRG